MPIYVATLEDLNNVRNNLSGEYIQTADIDANPTSDPESPYYNSGAGWEPIGIGANPFTGSYDGGGFTVDALFINRGGSDNIGLFGYVSGTITGLRVTNCDITGSSRCGALAGAADQMSCSITQCYSSGTVTAATRSGGLIGSVTVPGLIYGCQSSCDVVVATERAGGLCGQVWTGCIVENCSASGTVQAGSTWIGGLIGLADGATIRYSQANCSEVSGGNCTGGFIGQLQCTSGPAYIYECSATGTISGADQVGGFIGTGTLGHNISKCSFSGTVSGDQYVGGFIGFEDQGVISESYATGSVTGRTDVGGFAGGAKSAGAKELDIDRIVNCYTLCNVTGGAVFVGFVSLYPLIRNCYAAGIGVNGIGWYQRHYFGPNNSHDYFDEDVAQTGLSNTQTKTTLQMKTLSTFGGWDIARESDHTDEVWIIGDTDRDMYPELYEFYQPSSDISYTADVDLFDFHITSYSDSLLYTINSLSYNTDIDIVQDTLYTADILLSKHWRVKDTGDSSFDGIYIEEGEVNGQVYYTHGEGVDKRYLYFDPPSWGLTKDSEFTESKKEYIDHDKLPGNPWEKINDGVDPAPTVAELQEDKYYTNILLYETIDAVYNSNIIILKTENTTLFSDASIKDTYNPSFNTDVFLKAIVTVSYAPASANGNSSNQQVMFF